MNILSKILKFYYLHQTLSPLRMRSQNIYDFPSPHHTDTTYQIRKRLTQQFFLEEDVNGQRKTKVARRRTPSHTHLYRHTLAQEPLHRDYEFYNFGGAFRIYQYYIHSFTNPCPGLEMKYFKEIMHFHYMIYMTTPQHKIPYSGHNVHDIYNFGGPYHGHHYSMLSLSCPKFNPPFPLGMGGYGIYNV